MRTPSHLISHLTNQTSVFGVYCAASFLHADMWHMLDSYAQYLFVVSSYTNILNVYAFSNWHDVSWVRRGAGRRRGRSTCCRAKVVREHVVGI